MQTSTKNLIGTLCAERDQIIPDLDDLAAELEHLAAKHKKLGRTKAALDKAIDDLSALDDPNWKPAPKAAKSGGGRIGDPDYPSIADWIAHAKANGTYSISALCSAFNAKESTAANWISACRKRGLLTKDNKRAAADETAKTPPPGHRAGGSDRRQDPRLQVVPGRVLDRSRVETDRALHRATRPHCHKRREATGGRVTA